MVLITLVFHFLKNKKKIFVIQCDINANKVPHIPCTYFSHYCCKKTYLNITKQAI